MSKAPKHKFITPLQAGREASRTISVRITEDMALRFDNARDRVQSHGFDLNITDIVRKAIDEAISEANRAFPDFANAQKDLQLSPKAENGKADDKAAKKA